MACLPTAQDPTIDLNSRQNVHGPPGRPSVHPTALFLQAGVPQKQILSIVIMHSKSLEEFGV